MLNAQTATSEMPLVRLKLINPFIAELQRRNVDSIPLLERVSLPREMPIADEVFVPAGSDYDFLELATAAAGDRYLGAIVGRDIELESWPPFAESMDASTSINELLSHFVVLGSLFCMTSSAQTWEMVTGVDQQTEVFTDTIFEGTLREGAVITARYNADGTGELTTRGQQFLREWRIEGQDLICIKINGQCQLETTRRH